MMGVFSLGNVLGENHRQGRTVSVNESLCLSGLVCQVWVQQCWLDEEVVKRRAPDNMPPSGQWIRSPYDPDVRYGRKRGWDWIGYKVHLTETCDPDCPHFITQVETVPAIEQDHHTLTTIQANLAAKDLLPAQQLVDAGYVSAKRIFHSRDRHQIELVGPVHIDPSWQAKTEMAYDVSAFVIHWKAKQVICPTGQQSSSWNLSQDAKGESVVQVLFAKQTCAGCAARSRCTTARKTGRSMTLRYPPERHELLQVMRQRQQTPEFKAIYQRRAGIEGTFTQVIRNCGLRHARYWGYKKHISKMWLRLPPPISCVSFAGSMRFPSLKHEPLALPLLHLLSSPTVSNSG